MSGQIFFTYLAISPKISERTARRTTERNRTFRSRYANCSTGISSAGRAFDRRDTEVRVSPEAQGECGALMGRAARVWGNGKRIGSYGLRFRGQRKQGLCNAELVREIVKLRIRSVSKDACPTLLRIMPLIYLCTKQTLFGKSNEALMVYTNPAATTMTN